MEKRGAPSSFSKKPISSTYDAITPILRSLGRQLTNLPAQATALIGRQRELEVVQTLLFRPEVRLVTLTGPGGVGKTRLALEVAWNMVEKFPDKFPNGVFLVPLGPVSDPSLVISAISGVLGVSEGGPGTGRGPLAEVLKENLRDKQTLLVLDNFEHLMDAGPQIADLLSASRKLKIVVTSRSALHLRAENEFIVNPLAVPNLKRLLPTETLSQFGAIALFTQRAAAAKPDFRLADQNARTISEICVRLDGLPLALELAAARIKLLTPEVLLQRLGTRLELLTGGARDLPARQQTLRNAIAWSHDLLRPSEKTLFRRLAVCAGGCTLDVVEAVCSGASSEEVLDGLSSLVDKSLIRREDFDSETRFVMLETIREYALESLGASGEEDEIRMKHANFFLTLAKRAEPHLRGPRQAAWLDRLERDHDNLRTAIQWSVNVGEAELALELAGALWRFWWVRGYVTEGREWLSEALMKSSDHTPARARALRGAGGLASLQNDHAAAQVLHEECLAIFKELGDKLGVSIALHELGNTAYDQGDYASAHSLYEQSLVIKRELGDQLGTAMLLNNLGMVAQQQGDCSGAKSLYEQSLMVKRELGDKLGVAISLYHLARVACDELDHLKARSLYEQSLMIERDLGDKGGVADCLEGLAEVACAMKFPKRAARLFGAAEVVRETFRAPIFSSDRGHHERIVAKSRDMLTGKEFESAWSEGRLMTLEEAMAYALRGDLENNVGSSL